MKNPQKTYGFTLLELASVMVIIGLIAGSVMVGQSMIRASKLQSMISEFHQYRSAILAFKDKYSAYPGDMINATSIWGADNNCPFVDNDGRTKATIISTCNGNGDEAISTYDTTNPYRYEVNTAWQQLANANFIKGSYDGLYWAAGSNMVGIGSRQPASQFTKAAGWWIYSFGRITGHSYYFDGLYGHVLTLTGGPLSSVTAIMTPVELKDVDTKIDDGLPGKGIVRNSPSSGLGLSCSTTASADTAVYAISDNITCLPFFITGF